MRTRKTIDVETIKAKANHMLKYSADCRRESRQAVASFLEVLLHDSGNYNGFTYLSNLPDIYEGREIPTRANRALTHGVKYDVESGELLPPTERFKNTDETRRYYY